MDSSLKEKADLMISNYYELKTKFKFEPSLVKHFSAILSANHMKKTDIDKLVTIKNIIKESSGWASYFRGTNTFLLSSLLCLEQDYKDLLSYTITVHDIMRSMNFKKCHELPLAAYTIAKSFPSSEWEFRIERMDQFYKRMKDNHYWLTSPDDYTFAAILASCDLDIGETINKMETCYTLLNGMGMHKGNSLQALSHILALSNEAEKDLCPRVMKIYSGLKAKKCVLEHTGLPSLGLLALLFSDEEKCIDVTAELYDYIYKQNGYGFWSLDKTTRAILTASLISNHYLSCLNKGILQIALANSILAIIAAHESTLDSSGSGSGVDI